ncbi:MAG: hypothetical protein L0287_12705 [Anaerolineae bacterium]|nr:hypothetical protein [Anaerolineae bacterium]MCI0608332.1 hypothetical protein [Anaerolineae bacterium]
MLQGVIIWTPMLAADNLIAAKHQEAIFFDSRVIHYWDPDRIAGGLLSKTLKLKAPIAWDVYLLYPPDQNRDSDLPPSPGFWMHQLDEEPALFLDPLRLIHTVEIMIEGVEHE